MNLESKINVICRLLNVQMYTHHSSKTLKYDGKKLHIFFFKVSRLHMACSFLRMVPPGEKDVGFPVDKL